MYKQVSRATTIAAKHPNHFAQKTWATCTAAIYYSKAACGCEAFVSATHLQCNQTPIYIKNNNVPNLMSTHVSATTCLLSVQVTWQVYDMFRKNGLARWAVQQLTNLQI